MVFSQKKALIISIIVGIAAIGTIGTLIKSKVDRNQKTN